MTIKRISDNKFIAVDSAGKRVGTGSVSRRFMPRIFPDCPVQIVISVSCQPECRDLLYGAAVTRARMLAKLEEAPCRVYAEVDAGAKEELDILRALGFTLRDGITRMQRFVTDERITMRVPRDCTIVRDFLEREDEMQSCLKRYNECFGLKRDRAWLEGIASQTDFARILMVSPEEMCGELMVWSRGSSGVIGIIQTARSWRQQGVASYLLEDARMYFAHLGLRQAFFDVWTASPGCLALARKCGYKNGEALMLYPEFIQK